MRQVQTQRDRLGLRPDPGEGIPRRVAGIAPAEGCRQLRIAQQPIGADKGQHGGGIATGQAGQLLRQVRAGFRAIACAYGPLGDDHPLVGRIVFEHHRVAQEATDGARLVSWRPSPRLSLLHTLPRLTSSHPSWEGWTLWVLHGCHAGQRTRGVTMHQRAACAAQGADGSTPRVVPPSHQAWWASRAVALHRAPAPCFFPVCLPVLGLSGHPRAVGWTSQASRHSPWPYKGRSSAAGGTPAGCAPLEERPTPAAARVPALGRASTWIRSTMTSCVQRDSPSCTPRRHCTRPSIRTVRPLRSEAPTVSAWRPNATTLIQHTSACQVSPWRRRVGTASPHRATAVPFGAYPISGSWIRLPRKYTRCNGAIGLSPLGRSWGIPAPRAAVWWPLQRARQSPDGACRPSDVGRGHTLGDAAPRGAHRESHALVQ